MFRHYLFIDYATQGYILLVGTLVVFFHDASVPLWAWLVGAHATLPLLIHVLIRAHGRGGGRVLDFFRHFYPVLLYVAFYRESGMLSQMFVSGHLDPVVIHWEQRIFGFQPSMQFMASLPWLPVSETFYVAYFSYYVMIAGVGLALFVRRREAFFHYVSVLSFVFYVCYLIYIFLPVIGPRIFTRSLAGYTLPPDAQAFAPQDAFPFPAAVTRGLFYRIMALIYDVFEAPGAALPSSHVAASICTVWFSFRYRLRVRHLHLVMVILLCLSTVYCRYHYVIDVVAGLLTVAVLLPLGNKLFERYHEPLRAGGGEAPAAADAR